MKHIQHFIIYLGIFLLHFSVNAQSCEDLSAFQSAELNNRFSLILIDINPIQLCEQLDFTNLEDKFVVYSINLSELEQLHQIAPQFIKSTKDKLELPTLLFLDKNHNIIQSFHGKRSSEELRLLLDYFGNEYFEHIPWCKFKKIHKQLD